MDFGLIVDVETTGIDPENDKIIEIGLMEFAVDDRFKPVVTGLYGGVEDPGQPLLPEIKKLTGLDDPYLAGRRIDWGTVRQYFDRASIVIAHNCAFDRDFLMRRSELAGVGAHWACSIRHVDWEGKGFRSRALNYLAADHGFVNPFAHRALFDCATTFRVIEPYFAELVANSYLKEVRIYARGAAFEVKDKLRERSYKWDPQQRVWFKDVFENRLEEERTFLSVEVYRGEPRHEEVAGR